MELVEDNEFRLTTDNIIENILEAIVAEFKISEAMAIKTIYSSKAYEKLSNEDTFLWQKSWQEIYEIIKEECRSVLVSQ